MRLLARVLRRCRQDERGFTLVELLVTIAARSVIIGALLTVVEVTLRQTSRTFSQTNASQTSRYATDTIENELHSACLSGGLAPIRATSDGSNLTFISQYGSTASNANAATPTPVQHTIVYSSTNGTLTDFTYPATGGGAPNWTFATTASSQTLLLAHVAPITGTPVFQYFAYSQPTSGSTPYADAAGNTYMMLQDGINFVPDTTIKPAASPLAVPLTAATAANASEVLISFVGGPGGGSLVETGLQNVGANVQDQVVLRMTPPANHAGNGAVFTPCA
jgi:prepilin-type N-terminal cleavage/methylation domain-containing protein